MICSDTAKFLNVSAHNFTAQDGRNVDFYKIEFIPDSDHKPISINCTKDVYQSCAGIAAYDDIFVTVELFSSRGYLKQRCTYVGVADGRMDV